MLGGILFTFRVRNWPDYFFMELFNPLELEDGMEEEANYPDIINAEVTEKLINEDTSYDGDHCNS